MQEIDERLFAEFTVQEIVPEESGFQLRDAEKPVIGEISLKVYINGTEYASLLCLNELTEELALGFLYSEGVIDSFGDVASIAYNERLFAVMLQLVQGKVVERCESLRSVTSGCGKCFTYINPLKNDQYHPQSLEKRFSLGELLRAMQEFEQRSILYQTVGGVHSLLFSHPDFNIFNEDIGRHNCFDKITGVLLRQNRLVETEKGALLVSGRVSSEIITKVIRLGVPVLCSRATPTAAAVALAREYNVTLLGYVRGEKGYIYSGAERLIP
ncbi:MAG: formate dehydrogenase accessory sulfurtransferase FdhD [Syntrophaceae bacterium]|nr:formate dehydrogenase accessory sulfurtransferase FdhD [Syntrophaceae bacterium]